MELEAILFEHSPRFPFNRTQPIGTRVKSGGERGNGCQPQRAAHKKWNGRRRKSE